MPVRGGCPRSTPIKSSVSVSKESCFVFDCWFSIIVWLLYLGFWWFSLVSLCLGGILILPNKANFQDFEMFTSNYILRCYAPLCVFFAAETVLSCGIFVFS